MNTKIYTLDWWTAWIQVFAGCFLMVCGFVFFINPYGIVPGGSFGTSIVLHKLVPSVQVGTFSYTIEIPLLLLSFTLLGRGFGVRTIVVSLLAPLMMNIISLCAYPTREALDALDPAQLLGGVLDLSDHLMLTTIFGSLIVGVGCGMIVNGRATSGGSDIVALIIQKYLRIPFSKAVLMVDAVVVLAGLIVIGFGVGTDSEPDHAAWLLSLYSLISIFIMSRTVAYVINGSKNDKLLFVISEFPMQEFREFILNDIERTATIIKSHGLYTGGEKQMLFLVVTNKEVAKVKAKIKEVDPCAFVVVTDAYDTYGEGFKVLPNASELQPE